jgi:epoxyqueuosine reductase QueG
LTIEILDDNEEENWQSMKEEVCRLITDFVLNYPSLRHTKTRLEEPLIACASAQDPLFLQMKEIVSSAHFLPTDIIEDARTVITFYLPFSKEVNLSNLQRHEEGNAAISSAAWARAYLETNQVIVDLNTFIHEKLAAQHYQSSKLPPTHNFDRQKLISAWSHKHVAYIAGLGKFGLHQMLITEKGCSGRLGSIVTNLELEPTARPQEEYCLYKHNRTCARCVQRCFHGALQKDAYDRQKCYESCLINAAKHADLGYADVCGKCISDVPCSFVNPCRGQSRPENAPGGE